MEKEKKYAAQQTAQQTEKPKICGLPNMPEKKFRIGAISATIWRNTTQKDGVEREYRTISFERGYQDKLGNWKSTGSLRVADLPKAELVLKKAYEYVMLTDRLADNLAESITA